MREQDGDQIVGQLTRFCPLKGGYASKGSRKEAFQRRVNKMPENKERKKQKGVA